MTCAGTAFTGAVRVRRTSARPSQKRSRNPAAVSLDERERSFVRDNPASVNSDGRSCVQRRGGPRGFLDGPGSLAFSGNRRYIGDVDAPPFLCPRRRRLRVMGRRMSSNSTIGRFPNEVADARAERAWGVDIAALDRDCASPVTPRCTKEELPFGGPIARVRDPGTRLEPAA